MIKKIRARFRRPKPRQHSAFLVSPAVVAEFTDTWADSMLALHVAPNLTCSEVDALSEMLSELGQPETAALWIECHAEKDEPDDTHYAPA
jgi:hypothetical protein